jgi:2-polyprenyl-3-methyl-5-hydroxy-6-metoxy-1,4-benzoquinol methylase
MLNKKTDHEWEKFGKINPYYGVLTLDKYRLTNLTNESKEEFFRSGFEYIDTVLRKLRMYIDAEFAITEALDFGCGVGRLVIPLSKVSEHVTGIDVSASMLQEANRNCEIKSITNVDFVKSDDNLSLLNSREFNFIHSVIVFQHIPVNRGESIFQNLISHLRTGGCGVIHFVYSKQDSNFRTFFSGFISRHIPFGSNFINIVKGKPFFAPNMQMNKYNLNRLFLILQTNNVSKSYFEFTNDGGELGVILYFQKNE